MTGSARWLAVAGILGLYLGIIRNQTALSLLSLSVLLWLLTEWIWFLWRVRMELPRLSFERKVNGRDDSNGILWAGRLVRVDVKVRSARGSIGPALLIRDAVPENMEVIRNRNALTISSRFRQFTFTYQARVRGAGRLRLPGFRVTLQDAQGFFRCEQFIPGEQVFRVLPAYADTGETQPSIKRINSLPQHGIHRLQRSGLGSELLELREYVDGDPPKSIAWKVSARRDRLMTRQYESEVPVRVQLFIDGSIGTRVGGFGLRLLDQMNWVAATVARCATKSGDPVGAVLFDERGITRVTPQSGERGFHNILKAISDFSVNPSPVPDRLSPGLITFALSVVSEQFPELLDLKVNRVPFTWFPILPWSARRHRDRCLLAGVLAELYEMSPLKNVQLMHDDALMAAITQHFLSQTGLSWITPVVAVRNRGFHDGLARLDLLGQAISSAVLHARDNEVFVIHADLLESTTGIAHLIPAVRMARARHHRVAFVCPTPAFCRPAQTSVEIESTDPEDLLLIAEQQRTRHLAVRLRSDLRRVGAAVTFSGEQNAVRMILSEIEMARTGRTHAT